MQNKGVQKVDAASSLVDFLARRLDCSLRKAKAMLDERRVFVNRRRIWMARHQLKKGDIIEIIPATTRKFKSSKPATVLFENADYLFVDKPAGRLANGPDSTESDLRGIRQEPQLEAIHRLDRDTSGCLWFARNATARSRAVDLFRDRTLLKVYHAIVLGPVGSKPLSIRTPIEGQPAVTHVQPLSSTARASHVKVQIETGRTHQIRKHLAGIGHPVLGDSQYLTASIDDPLLRKIPRQMLHAAVLQMTLPGQAKPLRVEAHLPTDFKNTLRVLGLR